MFSLSVSTHITDYNKEYLERLAEVEVEFPVRTVEEAKSDECIGYCEEKLKAGLTYAELRRKLGLGPASHDKRWRAIRDILANLILPSNGDEAVEIEINRSGHFIKRIEELLDEVDRKMIEADPDNHHHFLKIKLETLKALAERTQKTTELYLKNEDIKKKEKRRQGTTIIFKNNFKIARPGEREVSETIETISKVKQDLKAIE